MRVLHLHIGHDKTGSSFLQNKFRKSRAVLRDSHGIWYPPREEKDGWSDASITAGNGHGLLKDRAALREGLELTRSAPRASALFSSEYLFWEMSGGADRLDMLASEAEVHGFAQIRILLLIRNPVEFLASAWQQQIKGEGANVGIDDFFVSSRLSQFNRVEKIMDWIEAHPSAQLKTMNYSVHRRDLAHVATDWLGIPSDALAQIEGDVVNRALAAGELELQRAVNRRLGREGPRIAARLAERLPTRKPLPVYPSRKAQQAAWELLADCVDRINARLPETERYRQDFRDPPPDASEFIFDAAQLDLIAELIAELSESARHVRTNPLGNVGGLALGRALLARVARRLRLG